MQSAQQIGINTVCPTTININLSYKNMNTEQTSS